MENLEETGNIGDGSTDHAPRSSLRPAGWLCASPVAVVGAGGRAGSCLILLSSSAVEVVELRTVLDGNSFIHQCKLSSSSVTLFSYSQGNKKKKEGFIVIHIIHYQRVYRPEICPIN